jgi:cellulose synthase/poly-beta-1,6-N-acetylglucosamine synthase-like glycosyltransferase
MTIPAVTLVVLTYNQGRYIDDALASVAAQTSDEFEVVLVDNASTDDSAERLKRWLPKLPMPAKLVVNPRNLGVSGGKNKGIELGRGEFICVLAGDDVYEPTKIARGLEMLRTLGPEVGVLFGDATIITDDGEPCGRWFAPPRHFAQGQIFADLCGASFIPAPTTMIRRHALEAVGGYDERRFVEDYDMWLRLAARGYEFRYLDEPLVRYRLSPLGASRNPATQALTRESMARSLLEHVGVSPETDAVISRETWALARQVLAIDASLGRPLLSDVYRFDANGRRRLQVGAAAVPGAPWMLRWLYRVRSHFVTNGFRP